MTELSFTACTFRWTLTAVAAIMLSVGSNAHAQTTASESANPDDTVLDEVVVTAQRYASSVQKTPIAVTAITSQAFEDRAITNVLTVAEEVPGIVIQPITGSSSGMRVVSRGAGQELSGFRSNAVMGMYIDDFIQPMVNGAFFDFFDIERVEVLRGPQGTLYGRNSSGGAMKLVTKRPSFDWTGGVQVGAGNWDQKEAKAYISGPIGGDKLAFSLSGVDRYRDGFVYGLVPERDVGRIDRTAWRAQVLYVPSDRVDLTLAAWGATDDSDGGIGVPLTVLPGVTNPYAVPGRSLSFSESVGATVSTRDDFSTSLNAKFAVSDALQIHSISGYGQQSSSSIGNVTFQAPEVTGPDGLPISIGNNNDGILKNKWWSQELNTTFENERLKAIVGLYYFKQEGNSRSLSQGSDTADADHGVEAPAIFAQATYWVSENVGVNVGARYTRETNDYFQYTFSSPTGPRIGESVYSSMTPKIGIDWQVTPSLFTYASYTKGFRSGGFNNRNPITGELEVNGYAPEYVDSYEIGAKFQTADNKFRLNVALFQSVYDHLHQAVFVSGTSFTITTPAAGAEAHGIEIEPTWQVFDELQLYGNMSVSGGKYTDPFVCTDAFSVRRDCSANELKGVIPLKTNIGFRFRPSIDRLPGQLLFNAAYAHSDKYYNNIANQLDIVQTPTIDLFNASLSWTDDNDRWRVSLEGRNLTDKKYVQAGLQTSNPIQPAVTAYPGPRRTIIARVGFSY